MEPKLRFKEFSGNLNNKLVSEIAEIFLGLTYTPKYVEDGVMFLSSKDISKDYLDLSDVKFISREEYNKSTSNAKPKKGDILFVRVGSNLGHPVILDIEDEICIFVSLGFLRVKKEFCNSYVKQWMLSNYFWKQVDSKVAGGAKNNLNTGWLKKFKLNIPSLSEQTKIADFLSTVDEKIQNQQDKITHLENIKKGFMQKIFSRKIRFKDANGNEFPEWEEKKLEDTIETIIDNRGKTPPISSSGYPLIEIASMQNNGLNYRKIEKYVSDETYKTWFRNHIKADDILFSTVGAYSGSLSYYDGKIKSCIAQNIIGLRFAQNSKFMMYLLSEKENQKRIQNIKMNQAQPSIKVTQMIKLKFLIPCLKEQQKIADFLSSFDEKIDAEKETLEHLKELKKGLLQQMFV